MRPTCLYRIDQRNARRLERARAARAACGVLEALGYLGACIGALVLSSYWPMGFAAP